MVYEEDLESDPLRGVSRVLEFLGLPGRSIQPPLRKAPDLPLAELVENLSAVRERLSGTPDEWMLEEGA